MSVWFKYLLYVLLPAAALVGMVFATMPVQFMVVQFGLPENLRVGHLTGTVWSGRATEVEYQGQLGRIAPKDVLADLVWAWCPGWHQGLAAMCVRLESPLLKAEGTFAYSLLGGGFEAFNTRLLAQVQGYPLNIGPVESGLKGIGEVNLERLSLDPASAQLLTGLHASGEVRDLQAGGFVLGDYRWRADLEQGTAGLTSDFGGGNDRFRLKGQAALDLSDRSYHYTANLETEDQGLMEMLRRSATQSGEKSLTFSGSGKLGS